MPHTPRTVRGILILAALACWTGCATTVPAPQLPAPAPSAIAVDGDALPALAFDQVRLEIPDHLAIGYHHEGLEYSRVTEYRWGQHFRDGRPALDADCRAVLERTGYRLDAGDPGAVQLAVRLVKVRLDSYAHKSSYQQAWCELRWELYRTGERQPFFQRTTDGGGRTDLKTAGAILAAFDVALHRLLADEAFVTALRSAAAE